jgi:hypothetical protein
VREKSALVLYLKTKTKNMRREFRIEPVDKGVHMQALPLCYHLNQKVYYASATTYTTWSDDNPLEGPIKTGEKILFSNNKNNPKIFVHVTYEDDKTLRTPETRLLDERKEAFINVFLARHPLTIINGKRHDGTVDPQFNIIDMSNIHVNKLTSFEDKFKVMTKLMSMTLDQKRDVCYYFGQTPMNKAGVNKDKPMTDMELGMFLTEPTSGLIIGSEKNIEKFREVFMQDGADYEFDIMIQKAVLLGVLESRIENKTTHYFLGSTLIGSTVTELQSFFKNDPELYEQHIVPGVKEKDNKKAAETETLRQIGNIKNPAQDGKLKEIADLREEIKSYKKDGFVPMNFPQHRSKYEELIAMAQEAREKKKQKELAE